MLALIAVSTAAMTAEFPSISAELPLWGLLSLGFLLASLFLLGNVQASKKQEDSVTTQGQWSSLMEPPLRDSHSD
jgi:hypothetical protein